MQDWRASIKIQRRENAGRRYADLCSAQIKQLTILIACCALVASSYSESVLGFLNQFASIYSFCLSVMLIALILPARIFFLSIPLAAGALTMLSRVNELKISAVSLPITFFDVKTVITDPKILVNAIGIRDDLYRTAAITAGLLIFGVVASAFYKIRGYSFLDPLKLSRSRCQPLTQSSSLIFKAVTLVVVLIAAQISLARYGRFVHANLNTLETKLWLELWLPASQITLSRKLGFVEYLAFSSFAADDVAEISLEHAPVPTLEALRVAASEFVNNSSVHRSKTLLPNIVFFHAESTFDPNLAFRLSSRIDLPLWSKQDETRVLSPLRVNVIGGGSWVTEFEVITGIDSRIFGYQGFYTHYYLAPKVKNSFTKYLRNKGYNTAAFYPVEGSFYNAEKAFSSYGFEKFTDGRSLGLPEDWGSLIDRNIIKAVIEHGAFKGPGPFFYFISTSENHAPHACGSFDNEHQFLTRFAASVSFDENCQLNEYLRRAISTSVAVELVLNQLKQIETQTGRPFVLLIYGDHQPWSFTQGIYSIPGGTAAEQALKNFSGVRTNADGNLTFFHLLASDRTVIRSQFTEPPPASFLPSLVSAFVATSHDDLYLPLNFIAYSSCGSDIRASGCQRYAEIARSAKQALLTEPASRAAPLGTPPSWGPLPERP